MLWNGVPEVVALWHGHLDQDLFAWDAAKICYAYDQALLAVEENSLRKEENTEGNHFHTVLNEIAIPYPNLFIRNKQNSTLKDWEPKYGFYMGGSGEKDKGMVCDNLKAALRDELYIEKDFQSICEFKWFETKPNSKLGAIDGKNDDLVIVSAGSYWLSSSYMNPPKLIEWVDPKDRKPKSRKVLGESSF